MIISKTYRKIALLKHIVLCSLIYRPVIIEVPHFAALRGKEREIVILRSDNGETWREHTLEATEDAVQEVLQESFDAEGKEIRSLLEC